LARKSSLRNMRLSTWPPEHHFCPASWIYIPPSRLPRARMSNENDESKTVCLLLWIAAATALVVVPANSAVAQPLKATVADSGSTCGRSATADTPNRAPASYHACSADPLRRAGLWNTGTARICPAMPSTITVRDQCGPRSAGIHGGLADLYFRPSAPRAEARRRDLLKTHP